MRRLVETLVAQLVEVMPELTEAAAWPAFGRRRRKLDLGQALLSPAVARSAGRTGGAGELAWQRYGERTS